MRVIAHRGANREALENTWQAFELAIAGGSDRIELDVHLTADGYAAVHHDDSLYHTTGVNQRITTLSRDALQKIRLPNGEGIPFLDEVCDRLLPRIELNIEIKGSSEQLAQVVCSHIADRQDLEKVIVSSFCIEPLRYIKHHFAPIKTACLWGFDTFTWPFFAHTAPTVFMSETGSRIIHPEAKLVTENFMDQAIARGWQVFPWVPMAGEEDDREGLWTYLYTLGVDGLCTNYPRQLRVWLGEASSDLNLDLGFGRPHVL